MAEVVDADSHVYEPAAIWANVPDAERDGAKAAFFSEVGADGVQRVTLNGEPGKPLNRHALVRQAIWQPGMTVEEIGALDPDVAQPLNPGAFEAAPRLADMDTLGIAQAIVYPTLFLEYLPLVEDTDAAASLARAYNDWVLELCAAGDGRLHPVAVLPLQQPELALAELERVGGAGFVGALMRPAFYDLEQPEVFGGMFAMMGGGEDVRAVFIEDKPYRPVWQRVSDLGLVACVHPSANVAGPDRVSSGGFTERVSERVGVQHSVGEPIAYMQDADLFMTAAFFHGLFEDLPSLKVAITHGGTTWLPLALEKCETYLWLGMGGSDVCLEPEEVWESQRALTTFDSWETPVARMADRIGDKAAWGSRYPHHDAGIPADAIAMLERYGVDQPTIDRLMGGHAADLFGLKAAAAV
jgi:predicted TIM-barrel fold metal-dependent hydrolase